MLEPQPEMTPAAIKPLGAASRANRPTLVQRMLSFVEFVVGGVIVIGHNVFHVIPNEVPILAVLGLISFQLRDGSWMAMGLRWPKSWRRVVLIALAAAALRILLAAVVIDPLTAHFWPPAVGPKGINEIAGHPLVALHWLLIVWTFAAFGEEIGYRGYLINRAADVCGREDRVLAGCDCRGDTFWVRALLQGPVGNRRLRRRGTDSRRCVPYFWPQFVDVHSGPRLHRYIWSHCLIFRMVHMSCL